MHLSEEDVDLLEELFVLKGISFDPQSPEDIESAYNDVTFQTILSLQQAVEDLRDMVEQVIFFCNFAGTERQRILTSSSANTYY